MRSKAKGSSARSGDRMGAPAGASAAIWAAGLTCLFVVLLLASGANRAAAGTVSERPLLFTFNGADSSAGAVAGANALDIDQANDLVYVIDEERDVVDKFNLAGVAQSFSSTGSSSLSPGMDLNSLSSIAVDNSPANPGRIHVMTEGGPLKAFSPTGEELWSLGDFQDVCGLAVDGAGHPWVGDYSNSLAREYATSGSPPSQTGSVSTAPNQICRLALDAGGNLYANNYFGSVDKYVGGVKISTLDAESSNGVAVDQSNASGHVFTLHEGSFNEYDAAGNLLGSYGAGTIGSGAGIAYDAGTDLVYVSDRGSNTIEVFGPPVAIGTVPDVTIEPTSEVGVNEATFHGTVNPQSVPNSYHFEWKVGAGSSWASAQSSPPVSLPEDSSDHAVTYTTTSLGGGREYEVRLVGVNTENSLRAFSSPDTFTTAVASTPPSASIDGVSAITATSAHVSATIDSHEDLTEWNVELSTDPACQSGFQSDPTNTISGGHAGTDAVGEDLTNLLPSERYCVRISATNSAGTTTSESNEFEAAAVSLTQVFPAFAAPRTDTTARLNGYVNPEGSAATYRFEYSEDGSSWTVLPDLTSPRARRQIVVGEEVSGLQPATTYHYRFTVENGAGAVQSDEKTFETRSTAEMQLPQRGVELVNKPNKGNQNIAIEEPYKSMPVSADGDKLIWKVLAGAPGATTGTQIYFLSTRTPSGWQSQPLAPPASQQVGGGSYAYQLNAVTPDFHTFLMKASLPGPFQEGGPPTFLRITDQYHQEALKAFAHLTIGERYEAADMTANGAHVLIGNPETEQVEEIGPGAEEVVSIMPDGLPAACGVEVGNFYGFIKGNAANYYHYPDYHRMDMTDASRLFFEAMPNGGSCSAGHHVAIYYRDRNADRTVEIDPGTAQRPPGLIRATPDGRSVFFVTETSHSPEDENTTGDVYRWDSADESYTCLTCVVPEADVVLNTGNSGTSIMVSDDFSHVYFGSEKQLVPGHGTPGEESLYSLAGGRLNYVAAVGSSVLADGATLGARLSADGNVMLFTSRARGLTADDEAAECKVFRRKAMDQCKGLFRYEDSTDSLECLSCLPGGVTAYDVPEDNEVAALSDDGSTVAFVTHEKLLAQDINNTEDVYEWRNGALKLITDGETPYPSTGFGSTPRVYGMGADGRDVFFTVVQPGLTGYEQDSRSNLYDARIGGGFPRPAAPQHCSEESCQGPLQTPPSQASAGSTGLVGAGNVPTAHRGRCAARHGKARRRCSRKPQHKRKHHKHHLGSGNGERSQHGTRGAK